ncbi:rho guanine nucleotide exchange factor 5 isoform X2 [Tupaia chinensis]|uniref:rho guanine nucleotide exchange factor 5 isoform X2 n=2 Tax=Tupaia chinensis TaxID=246437 RepID=UPI000703CD16|nr:rho guanine nucleotide exchange factor 5 isoform X2 [Tupaia chinensis]
METLTIEGDSALMEAEEPQHGPSTPNPAIVEFSIIPEALMRSSQIPAVESEGQENQDLYSTWTEGGRPLVTQQRELSNVHDYAAERMPSFPKEGSADKEINRERFVSEAWDSPDVLETMSQNLAERQSRTLGPEEVGAYLVQGKCLDMIPISIEPDSRAEVEFQPQFTSFISGQAEEKEETFPDPSAQIGSWPPCEEHLVETSQTEDSESGSFRQGKELQSMDMQGSPGREGLLHLWDAQGIETQKQWEVEFQEEGMQGEDICPDGICGEQEQMVEQVDGKDGKQNPQQEQVLGDVLLTQQEERDRPNGDLEGLNYSEWGLEESVRRAPGQEDPKHRGQRKKESHGPEGSRIDSRCMQNQSLVEDSEKVTGKQDQGLQRYVMSMQGQDGEVRSWDDRLQGEGEALHGPSTPVVLSAEISSPGDVFPDASCFMTQTAGVQTDSRAEDLSPIAMTPTLEPPGWPQHPISLPASFPPGQSLDNKMAQDSQQEGAELNMGTLPGQGTEVNLAAISVAPPRTPSSATANAAEISITTTPSSASPLTTFVSKETSLAAHSPETSRAFFSTDNLSPQGVSETLPASFCGFPSAEAPTSPNSHSKASPARPPGSCTGAIQHLRSNSFPGSHRTEQALDLVGRSLSFSHSELPQRPPKPTIYGSVIPRRARRGNRDCSVISECPTASTLGQDSQELSSSPGRPSSPHSSQPWGSPHNPSFATGSPALIPMDMRIHEPPLPPPLEKRHIHPPTVEHDGHLRTVVPTLKQFNHPSSLALGSGLLGPPKGPLPEVPDPLVARQHRPLPSTPDSSNQTQVPLPPRQRYNKPLPPTPDVHQPHHSPASHSNISRIYKPLPPVPILDSPTEPPPLPPKSRGRSRSTQGGLMNSTGQAKPRPICQDWTVSTPPCAGRTSWPPAMGRSTESSTSIGRSKKEVSSGMAFSNVTSLLSPSSPTTPWTLELQESMPKDEPGLLEESEAPTRGSWRRTGPQEGVNGPRRSAVGRAKQPEKPGHPHLEKASSWPHRREPGRPPEGSSTQGMAPDEGPSKHKGWNRQGLRRPSILPEGSSDSRGPATERSPGSSDTIVFREKKPREVMGGFSRRCSKLINSSQLLYQEYSDVFLNKEIQSQQRLDSLSETPGPASPRQPRKALVSSESYLQRLSMASSGSLWQEIPVVRNSTVLLSMTHEDQKLQEAKFELIVSEASYLRSLHIAVDHFQHSSQLRATLSNQEHQWLFSRLQDVRDVSTTFLSDLEENFENNIFSFQVCDVVLNHAPEFRRVYLPYVTNQTYQERTFQSLLNSNGSFREVLDKLESDPICQRLSLKSFLILPFQRITRLKLLLQNILKRTQPGSSEEAEATKAHHALEELIRDCNNNVQRMRRTEELIYLSQKIEFECKIFPLISQSRWLVKSGELTALEFSVSPGLRRKLNTRPVHLHLFNDCLLLSRPREGNRFLVFDHAPFSSIRGEKCEMKLHGPHKNLFRLFLRQNAQGTQAEFLFSTETQSEKLRWISALAMPREELDLLECYDSPQVQCHRAYKPRENDELALEKADVVMVTQQSSDGWLEGVRLSDWERGWFPLQQVAFISNPEVRARNLKEAHRVKTAKLQLVEQQA